jgi:hypothetical protein
MMDLAFYFLGWNGDIEYHNAKVTAAEQKLESTSSSTPTSGGRTCRSRSTRKPLGESHQALNTTNNIHVKRSAVKKRAAEDSAVKGARHSTKKAASAVKKRKVSSTKEGKENSCPIKPKASVPLMTVRKELSRGKELLHVSSLARASWMLSEATTGDESSSGINVQVELIRHFISEATRNGGNSGSLYLCGKPGTGKVCYGVIYDFAF